MLSLAAQWGVGHYDLNDALKVFTEIFDEDTRKDPLIAQTILIVMFCFVVAVNVAFVALVFVPWMMRILSESTRVARLLCDVRACCPRQLMTCPARPCTAWRCAPGTWRADYPARRAGRKRFTLATDSVSDRLLILYMLQLPPEMNVERMILQQSGLAPADISSLDAKEKARANRGGSVARGGKVAPLETSMSRQKSGMQTSTAEESDGDF